MAENVSYEYKVINFEDGLEEKLNKLAKQGWRVKSSSNTSNYTSKKLYSMELKNKPYKGNLSEEKLGGTGTGPLPFMVHAQVVIPRLL